MDSTYLDALYEETMARFDQIFPSLKSMKSTDRKVNIQSFRINKKQCEHCGNEINKVALIKHSIIPNDISKQLGLENVKVLDLCFTCHRAIHDWNAPRISWVVRDNTNRLKSKPLMEVAKEYESAYQDFLKTTLNDGYNPGQLLPQLSSV
jgi:hypothetical protein